MKGILIIGAIGVMVLSFSATVLASDNDQQRFEKNNEFYKTCQRQAFLKPDKKTRYKINYCFFERAGDDLTIILPGNQEPLFMYLELAQKVSTRESVLVIDHLNQGESQRILNKSQLDQKKIYIKDFDLYLETIDLVLNQVFLNKENLKKKRVRFIAHSMGGLIALDYAKKVAASGTVNIREIILSSPMLRFLGPDLPDSFLYQTVRFINWLGFSKAFAFGQGSSNYPPFSSTNQSTTSKSWYNYAKYIYQRRPELRSYGNTFSWVEAAYQRVAKNLDQVENLRMPIMIFRASHDEVVDIEVMKSFCDKLSNCHERLLKGAKHDLFRERDIYQAPLIEAIFK